MTLPTGKPPIRGSSSKGGLGGFTLIELLLVMGMLIIVMSVSAPLLVRFFHGRGIDSEARRFLALTRYGQSRAVSEGVPMVLWIDPELGRYGLEEEHTYSYSTRGNEDGKAVEFDAAKDVGIEVEQLPARTRTDAYKEPRQQSGRRQPEIRFTPEGFISDASPDLIVFRQLGPQGAELREEEAGEIYIGRTDHRLNYEIKTNIVLRARR